MGPFDTSIYKARWSRDRQEIYSQDRSRKDVLIRHASDMDADCRDNRGVGLLTIKEGGSVLLGNEQAVSAAGDYVPFVLWFNTAAGFAYVAAGVGLWLRQRWAAGLSFAIAASCLIVLAALVVHVAAGGAYEMRTVIAMILRSGVWIAISAVAYRHVWQPTASALS